MKGPPKHFAEVFRLRDAAADDLRGWAVVAVPDYDRPRRVDMTATNQTGPDTRHSETLTFTPRMARRLAAGLLLAAAIAEGNAEEEADARVRLKGEK